jgi:hypothetical protein
MQDMERIFTAFAEKAPEMIVLFLMVKLFLNEMRLQRDTFVRTIGDINNENLEARKQSRSTIEDNTKHTIECTSAMATMTLSLQHFSQMIKGFVNDKRPATRPTGPENG